MRIRGIGVSPGTAVGPAVLVSNTTITPPGELVTDAAQAEANIAAALESVAQEMTSRAADASAAAREVLEATATMARDPGLMAAASGFVAQGLGPVDALHGAVEQYCQVLAGLDDYLAQRQDDLRDVFQRAAAHILGLTPPGIPRVHEPSLLIATDLAPADTATLDPRMVLGIVTEAGGTTSHTAILAAQLGIPAVVQAKGILGAAPKRVGLDGASGEVYLEPDEATADDLLHRNEQRIALERLATGPGSTSDGHRVEILANIGTADDAHRAAETSVEGSGLFRTEFLFLDRAQAPTLEEQTSTYADIFRAFSGRKVVVRTLDAGADKPLPFADLGPEDNPALGVRGLRLQREIEDLLDTQLRALAQARESADTDVWVMAPMVATAQETAWFTQRCREHGLPVAGTMIEVPAAALSAGRILDACDFASIGTNDLSQYLFAADRMNGRLAHLLDGWQPALWRLIHDTVEDARGKPVGICGEVAGDPLLALVATGAGVSSLSMALGKVGAVKACLSHHDLATCRAMLNLVLNSASPEQAREGVTALVAAEVAPLLTR